MKDERWLKVTVGVGISQNNITEGDDVFHPSSLILHPLGVLPHWSEDRWRIVSDTDGES